MGLEKEEAVFLTWRAACTGPCGKEERAGVQSLSQRQWEPWKVVEQRRFRDIPVAPACTGSKRARSG